MSFFKNETSKTQNNKEKKISVKLIRCYKYFIEEAWKIFQQGHKVMLRTGLK